VSNLNYVTGQTIPNAFVSRLDANGALDIYAQTGVNLALDVTGYYAPPQAGGLYYHPLPHPVRLLDTRIGQTACDAPGAPVSAATTRTEMGRRTCDGISIPDTAQAIVGNATVINTGGAGAGFVTLYASGTTMPPVSNLNYVAGQIVPNAFTANLGSDGAFNIYALTTLDFIADVTGYYSDTATPDANGVAGLLYYPLAAPVRLLDTRAGQTACDNPATALTAGIARSQPARLSCGGVTIPAEAQAVVGNATAINIVPGSGDGYVTLSPGGAVRPVSSNLNYVTGQIVPNAFIVGLGADGSFQIYASTSLHFITDVNGYFAP
jgi:hypothetical protein